MIWCTKCVMCFQNECLSRMVISPRGSVANATFESQQGTKAHGCLDLKASQWRGKRLRMNDINKLKLIHCQHNVNTKYSIATVIEWDHVNHVWQTARVGRKLQYKRPYLDCCFWIVSMLFSDVLPVTIGNSLSENNFQQMWSTTSSLELCPRSLQQWSWDLQFLVFMKLEIVQRRPACTANWECIQASVHWKHIKMLERPETQHANFHLRFDLVSSNENRTY